MLDTCEKKTAMLNKCSCTKQNEAAQETAEYIAHIYFTKSEKIFNEFMEFVVDGKFTGSYSRCANCGTVTNDQH